MLNWLVLVSFASLLYPLCLVLTRTSLMHQAGWSSQGDNWLRLITCFLCLLTLIGSIFIGDIVLTALCSLATLSIAGVIILLRTNAQTRKIVTILLITGCLAQWALLSLGTDQLSQLNGVSTQSLVHIMLWVLSSALLLITLIQAISLSLYHSQLKRSSNKRSDSADKTDNGETVLNFSSPPLIVQDRLLAMLVALTLGLTMIASFSSLTLLGSGQSGNEPLIAKEALALGYIATLAAMVLARMRFGLRGYRRFMGSMVILSALVLLGGWLVSGTL